MTFQVNLILIVDLLLCFILLHHLIPEINQPPLLSPHVWSASYSPTSNYESDNAEILIRLIFKINNSFDQISP